MLIHYDIENMGLQFSKQDFMGLCSVSIWEDEVVQKKSTVLEYKRYEFES